MTATQHIPGRSLRARGALDVDALTVCWEISPDAVRASPLPAIAAMNGQAERLSRAELVWRVEGTTGAASLRLEVGEDDVVVPLLGPIAIERAADESAGGEEFEHVWAAAGREVLALCIRAGRLVYARTSVLSDVLGLAGGVYDSPRTGPAAD